MIISKFFPVQAASGGMALLTGQGIFTGRNHVGDGPVHFRPGKTKLAAVRQSIDLCPFPDGKTPVEFGPESACSAGYRWYQNIVDKVLRLFGTVYLEGPYFCRWISP